ncbi:OLC1v1014760C7 [Oldenlandia corymbosa var. corymbosa]|uniref:OLC1v1014760C7 n=1 Tax=Oldenlandia corymbosa var. corymbosa TaxID=529605 RepID=A0AAV1E1N0_OLDCO|nr:OLC1v1014760C7 [Oldenlandia corymbosa var. corymbosa]
MQDNGSASALPESSTKGLNTDSLKILNEVGTYSAEQLKKLRKTRAWKELTKALALSPLEEMKRRRREGIPLAAPPVTCQRIYLNEDGSFPSYAPKFEKGTTVLGLVFEEGIMVAADHSTTPARNVVQLNSHMLATISGGGEVLLKNLQKKCNLQEKSQGREPTLAEVSSWLTEALSAHSDPLSLGILIAVWNESEHGLYRMSSNGVLVKGDILATGSGAQSSLHVVELSERFMLDPGSVFGLRSEYAPVHCMSVTEVAALTKRAICTAGYNAPHYGNLVSGYHLGTKGCVKLYEDNVEEWQKFIKGPSIRFKIIGKGW